MIIAENHVVSMHYTLKNDEGTVLDESKKAPLSYQESNVKPLDSSMGI